MYWLSFPFLRFTLAFSIGILLGKWGILPHGQILWMIWAVNYLFALLIPRHLSAGALVHWMVLILTGLISYNQSMKPGACQSSWSYVRIRRSEKISTPWHRYLAIMEAEYYAKGWFPSPDKRILLYLKDSIPLKAGDQLLVHSKFSLPEPPSNPYLFDYKSYLANRHIAGQAFVGSSDFRRTGERISWLHQFTRWRVQLLEKLRRIFPDTAHYQIMQGILLGEKSNLDPEVRRMYSVTGSMHVLAVSGLHVGILLMILRSLLCWLPEFPWSRFIKYFICMVGLLAYAALTEFSPSVVRAVTFFLIGMIGLLTGRQVKITHTFSVTAFLMLAYDPVQLFQPGFQLSFSAVTGILFFTPVFRKWWKHSIRWLDKILELLAVSAGAQLGTLAFVVYYFHLFPLSGLLSSLLVIPCAFILLGIGGVLLILPENILTEWLAKAAGLCLDGMHGGLSWLSNIPFSYINDIYLPWWFIVLILCVPVVVIEWVMTRKRIFWIAGVLLVLAIGSIRYENFEKNSNRKIVNLMTLHGDLILSAVSGEKGVVFYPANFSDLPGLKEKVLPWFGYHGVNPVDNVIFCSLKEKGELGKFDRITWYPGTRSGYDMKSDILIHYETGDKEFFPVDKEAFLGMKSKLNHTGDLYLKKNDFYEMKLTP